MQALELLPVDSLLPHTSESKERSPPTWPTRAEHVISKVFSVLSPLISAAQTQNLRTELATLVSSALDAWCNCQTGEIEILVNPVLEGAHREEWRCQQFDPVAPSLNRHETSFEIVSRTRPRIITLFPRVIARGVGDPAKSNVNLPGSWPQGSDYAPVTVETCIHPGSGLPQWSPLIVRGKDEEEERKEYLARALDDAKKELHSNRRKSGAR